LISAMQKGSCWEGRGVRQDYLFTFGRQWCQGTILDTSLDRCLVREGRL
jgi:hypothetical protein